MHEKHELIGFEDLMQTIVFGSGDGEGVCRRPVEGAMKDRCFIDRFEPIDAARIGVATERSTSDRRLGDRSQRRGSKCRARQA